MTTGPRTLLHRDHRLALWQRPLWVVVAALAVDFVLAQSGVDWPVRTWMLDGALVVALATRLLFRPSLHATACALPMTRGLTKPARPRITIRWTIIGMFCP